MIGGKIKRFRNFRGLTQKQLAQRVGITVRTITMYEKDKIEIKLDILSRIAYALGSDLENLINYGEDK